MNKKIITSALIASLTLPVGMTPVVNAAPQVPVTQPGISTLKDWFDAVLPDFEKKLNDAELEVSQHELASKVLKRLNEEFTEENIDRMNRAIEQIDGDVSIDPANKPTIKQKAQDLLAKLADIKKKAEKNADTYDKTLKILEAKEKLKQVNDNNAATQEEKIKANQDYVDALNKLSGEQKATILGNDAEKIIKDAKKGLENSKKTTQTPSSSTYYVGTAGGYASTTTVAKTTTTPTTETKPLETTPKLISADVQTGALFPNFKKSSAELVSSLNDPRLLAMQKQFGAETTEAKNKPLTRGEFLSMVIDTALVDVSKVDTSKLAFTDVKKDEKLAKYIAFAVSKNIISGYDNNTFRADNTISRAEATKILVEAIGMKPRDKQTQFTDVLPLNTLGGYIQTAYNNKLIHGTSLTTFEPNRTISKAELIKILFNITVSK